jgi:prevent-host-death family protein
MLNIRPSAYLRNNYNEVSKFCHATTKPMFITKNGTGDLAVMSIKTYENLFNRQEFYDRIEEGLEAINAGDYSNYDDFITEFLKEINADV